MITAKGLTLSDELEAQFVSAQHIWLLGGASVVSHDSTPLTHSVLSESSRSAADVTTLVLTPLWFQN